MFAELCAYSLAVCVLATLQCWCNLILSVWAASKRFHCLWVEQMSSRLSNRWLLSWTVAPHVIEGILQLSRLVIINLTPFFNQLWWNTAALVHVGGAIWILLFMHFIIEESKTRHFNALLGILSVFILKKIHVYIVFSVFNSTTSILQYKYQIPSTLLFHDNWVISEKNIPSYGTVLRFNTLFHWRCDRSLNQNQKTLFISWEILSHLCWWIILLPL